MNKTTLRVGLAVLAIAAAAFAWYQYRTPRYVVGDIAPDFEVTLADNSRAKLSDLRGKYVLLQFWGSWCGPCRRENPHLLALYQKYAPQGFEVFSIGIEQNPTAWARAIQQDGMAWRYHSADFRSFEGSLATNFNVKSIPATFLIDPSGTIIGVNLESRQMDKLLGQRFSQK